MPPAITTYAFSNNRARDVGYGIASPNSETAYQFYADLGNPGYRTPNDGNPAGCLEQVRWGLVHSAPFDNRKSYAYWPVAAYAPDPASST